MRAGGAGGLNRRGGGAGRPRAESLGTAPSLVALQSRAGLGGSESLLGTRDLQTDRPRKRRGRPERQSQGDTEGCKPGEAEGTTPR